ncbi:MAG: hypothetical protein Fur0012_10640 [Elusimicrobiota bacterium]
MYSVILSDKSFEIEALDAALKKAGGNRVSFMRDYGIIAQKPSLEEASAFSELCLREFSIKAVCNTRFQYPLGELRQVNGFSLKGTDIYHGNLRVTLSGLESIALCPVRTWERNSSIFSIKQKPFDFISKTKNSLFLQLCFDRTRLLVEAENFDYSLVLKSPSFVCEDNLKRLIMDLTEISSAATNKTLDLFLANKNIEYFLYEDIQDSDREIMWLKAISAKDKRHL